MVSEMKYVWLDVKCKIELDIIWGVYDTSGKLPTIIKLSELYAIGNTTSQKVLDSLYTDGIIDKAHGKGHYLKPNVKARLIEKHTALFTDSFNDAVQYGKRLGVNVDKLINCEVI